MIPELVESILEEYQNTNDLELLLTRLDEIEARSKQDLFSGQEVIFVVYQFLEDKKGMKKAAKNYFIQDFFFDDAEELLAQAGLKPTPALYKKRADYWFNQEYFDEALDMYLKVGNQTGAKKSIIKLESEGDRYREDVVRGYLALGDKESARKVAKDIFVSDILVNEAVQIMKKVGLSITKKLWKERAEYQFYQGIDTYNALEAFQKAQDSEGIKLAKKRIYDRNLY